MMIQMPNPFNIVIASKNPCKVETAKRVLRDHPRFADALVLSSLVESGVSSQPISLDEMYRGARTRAQNALIPIFDYAIGLESGIFGIPGDRGKHSSCGTSFDACFCVMLGRGPLTWVQERFAPNSLAEFVGMSSAFEVPYQILSIMDDPAIEMAKAVELAGWGTESCKHKGGLVSILTGGRVTREHQVEQALSMALARFDVPELWGRE